MVLEFESIHEEAPGAKWRALLDRTWPSYKAWFLREGAAARPTYLDSLRALKRFMPELVPTYETLVELAGGGDSHARMLSLYRPTPYLAGCSQAVFKRGPLALIRNYEYAPNLCEGALLLTNWNGRRVLAMSDCLWGALDGVNESGLAVSLAFGGRQVVGDGFGIPLLLRYVLEFCGTTRQAVKALTRIPSHMAYNVTILDARGEHATVYLAPDREAQSTRHEAATNHQAADEWPRFSRLTRSHERLDFLRSRLHDPAETAESLLARFLQPPLYSAGYSQGWGTLYTAAYRPESRAAEYRWPGIAWTQSIEDFREERVRVQYAAVA